MTLDLPPQDPRRPIAVLRPKLPDARKLLPYLERIDQNRVYSNWGPLVTELGERLDARFGLAAGSVVCASSGMAALVGGILAAAGTPKPGRPLALVPNFTFAASALAVQTCGYELAIGSCHTDSWAFSAQDLLARADLLDQVGLVVPVAPFGRVVDQKPWLQFQSLTGIPVVIDGAACFEFFDSEPGVCQGPLPVALSFHATKAFGVGEGGCVVTSDPHLSQRVLRALNFGFLKDRTTAGPSTNGKMSEYSAAVGLAELDGWGQKRARMMEVADRYRQALGAVPEGVCLVTAPQISCAYVLLQTASADQARTIVQALANDRIDTRFWYGAGLTEHVHFNQARLLDFHGPDQLDPHRLIGLPMAPDLGVDQIRRICGVIRASV